MSAMIDALIVALKTVILVLGAGVTATGYKAYRRTGDRSLGTLALGFGVITVGALLAGIAHQLLGVPLEQGIVLNSLLVAVGLAIITYSLYLET